MAKPETSSTPPTVEDVNAIGTAASTAAETTSQAGGTADQAGQAAAQAADAEAKARGIELPQAVIDQIAKASAAATVTELANQRAIVQPEDDDDQADEDQADDEAAGRVEDEKPRKVTLAEKLLKPYQR